MYLFTVTLEAKILTNPEPSQDPKKPKIGFFRAILHKKRSRKTREFDYRYRVTKQSFVDVLIFIRFLRDLFFYFFNDDSRNFFRHHGDGCHGVDHHTVVVRHVVHHHGGRSTQLDHRWDHHRVSAKALTDGRTKHNKKENVNTRETETISTVFNWNWIKMNQSLTRKHLILIKG